MLPKEVISLNPKSEVEKSTGDWGHIPGVSRIRIDSPAIITHPGNLPEHIARKHMKLSLHGEGTIQDFLMAIGEAGIPSVITDSELGSKKLLVSKYEGELGVLIQALSKTLDISFCWENGILAVKKAGDYLVMLAQDDEILKAVSQDLRGLGADSIITSKGTGTVRFVASGRYHESIMEYLVRAIRNAANINLQVAVISVSLEQGRETGIDWNKLKLGLNVGGIANSTSGVGRILEGNRYDDILKSVSGQEQQSTTGVIGANGLTGGTNNFTQAAAGQLGAAAGTFAKHALDATGGGEMLTAASFSLEVLLNQLSSYGKTRTDQNMVVKTLSGSKVRIHSGNEEPYVSSVSVSALGGVGGSIGGVAGGLGSANTEKLKTGITLEVTPLYDSAGEVMTMAVDLKIKSLLAFKELKAGNQVGTLSQPVTQEQEFNDVARLRAGDTVVIGGLIIDRDEDKRNNLVWFEDFPTAYQNGKRHKEALFVVIRPTAVVYEFSDVEKY